MIGYRWLINLVLLAVIVLLGSLVLTTPEKDPLDLPPLTQLKIDQVQHINISYPSETVIELAKGDNALWQIITSPKLPANQYGIKYLLQVLNETYTKKLAIGSLNLAEFGLSPPSVQISFDQTTLKFGQTSPVNQRRRYVQIDDAIYLILDSVSFLLSEDVLEFASLYPLGESAKVKSLQLPDYHLTQEKGIWQLTSPLPDNTNTNADALVGLVQHWEQAQAMDVLPYSDAESEGNISITLNTGETLRFLVISTDPTLVLARPDKGIQYEFSASYVDKLLHLPAKVDESATTVEPIEDLDQ